MNGPGATTTTLLDLDLGKKERYNTTILNFKGKVDTYMYEEVSILSIEIAKVDTNKIKLFVVCIKYIQQAEIQNLKAFCFDIGKLRMSIFF